MTTSHRIGIFHYQLGMTDGVSLEVEKWQTVLERMGHQVVLCAGRFGKDAGVLIPELYHHDPEIEAVSQNILGLAHSLSAEALAALIEDHKRRAKTALRRAILENDLDLLMVDNLWSVAMNIPAAMALEEVRQELGLRAIAHHHDFYWEKKVAPNREDPLAAGILDQYLPPRSAAIQHVVINSLAQASLAKCKQLPAVVIPNVFDFDSPDWQVDDYNADLRQAVGLEAGDVCVLQATRIIPRKGIELAIDLVAALNEAPRRKILATRGLADGRRFGADNKIVLVLAGYDRDDPTGTYLQRLKEKAAGLGVDLRHINAIIGPQRERKAGVKVYSLWDSYTLADLVTYPSLWEGWGNQLLEAFRAKAPVALFEYPVYLADICSKGFDVVSLGSEIARRDRLDLVEISTKILQGAADQCVELLTQAVRRDQAVELNYTIAERNYSYGRLKDHLMRLLLEMDFPIRI